MHPFDDIQGPIVYHRSSLIVSAGSGSHIIDVERVDDRGMFSSTGRWRLRIAISHTSTLPKRTFPITWHDTPDAALEHAWELINAR